MKVNRILFVLFFTLAEFCIFGQTPGIATDEAEDSLFSHLELDEIVVKAIRPLQKLGKGGALIDVQHTSLSKSGTLGDVLARIPSISKGKDGYDIVGKGKPVVYIDGRRIYDITEIDNLRSDQIAEIEVITNPGPEYGAQTYAVIKIRTTLSQCSGLGIDGGISYSGPTHSDYAGQVNINYLNDKLEIYETAKYTSNGELEKTDIHQTADIGRLVAQKSRYNVAYSTQRFDNSLAVAYKMTPVSWLGANYNLTHSPACNYIMTMKSDIYENGILYDHLSNDIRLHRLPAVSHKLNTFYSGNLGQWKSRIDYDYVSKAEGQSQTNSESFELGGVKQITANNKSKSYLHTLKGDIQRAFGPVTATGGIELNVTRRKDSYHSQDTTIGSSEGRLTEKMASGFATCQIPTGAGEFSAGLRFEHTSFRYITQDSNTRNTSNHFFPSLCWQKRFGIFQLRVDYTSKIQRPRYRDLSNEVVYVNSFCISTGNPLLKNAIHHEISLMAKWSTLTISASFRTTNNAIVYWGESYKDNSGITLLKMGNVPHLTKNIITITWAPVFGRFTPIVSSSCVKQWLSIEARKFNRPIITASIANTINCGKGWIAILDLNFRSRGNTENAMLNDDILNISASVRKSFFNDNWILQLKLTDLLNDCADNSTLYFPHHTLSQRTKWDSRSCSVSIRYNLHNANRNLRSSESINTNRL